MSKSTGLQGQSRERLAERVSAASYGSVLVLSALALLHAEHVGGGLYGEVVGEHLRHSAAHTRAEMDRAMTDGSRILFATVLPAIVLLLGLRPGSYRRVATPPVRRRRARAGVSG